MAARSILKIGNIVLVALLSLTAGAAKIMQVPAEVEFFRNAGLTDNMLLVFGVLQVVAGALLATSLSRVWGALLAALLFAVSTVMILLAGQAGFAVFSLVPVVLAGIIAIQCIRAAGHTGQ